MSNNHPNRNGRAPMTRPSYEKLARRVRDLADLIEANCPQETPQQKRTLTQAISNLHQIADTAHARHSGLQSTRKALFEARIELDRINGK